MIKNLLALVVFCFCGVTVATFAADNEAVNEWTGPEVRRWSPIVSDLDETIRLYRDILGFTLNRVTIDPPDSYVYTVFNIYRSITTRHAVFDAGEKKRVLSVVEVPGLKPGRLPQDPRTSALLVNANGNFDKIVAKLKAANYELLEPHKLGKNGIEMGFLDRDGHLYALYEIPYKPDSK